MISSVDEAVVGHVGARGERALRPLEMQQVRPGAAAVVCVDARSIPPWASLGRNGGADVVSYESQVASCWRVERVSSKRASVLGAVFNAMTMAAASVDMSVPITTMTMSTSMTVKPWSSRSAV